MADSTLSTEEGEQKEMAIKALVEPNTNNHNRVVDSNNSADLVHASESATSTGSVVDVSDVVLVCGSDSGSSVDNPVKMSDHTHTLLSSCSGNADSDDLTPMDRQSEDVGGNHDLMATNSSVVADPCDSAPTAVCDDKCDVTPTDCASADDHNRCDKFDLLSVGDDVSGRAATDSCDHDSLSPDVETNGNSSMMNTDSISNSTLGQLTKDDSGIDVTRSPNAIGQSKDKKTSGGIDAPQTSDGDRSVDRDGEHPVTSGNANQRMKASDDDTLAGVTVRNEIEVLMDTDDDDDSALRDDAHSQHQLDSNADDDDITDNDTNDKSAKSSDDDVDTMEVDLTPPADTWCPVREIRQREIGYGAQRVPTSQVFVQRTGGSVQLVRRLKLQHKLEHHEGCVNCLHFNESGTLLASGSDDLNIVIWNWVRNKPYLVFNSGHRANVFQSKFMPYCGDTHIISCARDGHVRLAELSSTGICKNTKKLAQHHGSAHKVALLQDSSHVCYSCGEDAVVYEIDLRQNKPNKLCTTKENDRKVALYSIHSNPFKSYEYCVGGRDHFIRVYDKRMINEKYEGALLKKFCPHQLLNTELKTNVTCSVYNYNGTEIIGTYNDEDIYLFDNSHSDGADFVHRYRGHRNNATVKGVNFYGPKSEFIVSGSDCGNVFLWEKNSEKIVNYFQADRGGVINVLEPHPHSPILATSGLDHNVKVWSPAAATSSKLDGLVQVMRRNRREREEERSSEPDMVDGQMLWLLMQRLRRHARNRVRDDAGDAGDTSTSSSDSDDDSDDSEDMPGRLQCAPS